MVINTAQGIGTEAYLVYPKNRYSFSSIEFPWRTICVQSDKGRNL